MSAAGPGRALGAVVGLLAAAVLVTLFLSAQIRTRAERVADALERAPARTVADFPAGTRARIQGRVRLGAPALVAPLSGRRCAHFELVIEGPGGSLREADARDFSVEDATGSARVIARGATIAVTREEHCVRGTLAGAPRGAGSHFISKRQSWTGVDPAELRYRECALVDGARVSVAGTSSRGARRGAGQRARLLLRATRERPLHVGDMAFE